MRRPPSTITHVEKQVLPTLKQNAEAVLRESLDFTSKAHADLRDVDEVLNAYDKSDKLLEDDKLIVKTLADTLPPNVAKVRDVETDFEEFDHSFSKLEESVKLYHERSRQTAEDIHALRKQVGALTQRQEASSRMFTALPALIPLVLAAIWYAMQR